VDEGQAVPGLFRVDTVKQIELRKAEKLLRAVEWSYPPIDALAGMGASWTRAKRCPVCFAEWNLAGKHEPDCELGAIIHRVQ
jgi:hypothetical protein